jgi:HK97 family phage portal protein
MAPYGRGRGVVFNLGVGRQDRETLMRTYGMSGTVFSIVSLLQQAAASPSWHLYKKPPKDGRVRYTTGDQGSDQRIEIVQHAAIKLWNQPNDFHSGFEFREGSNQHLELTGETFWVLDIETAGFPTAMWYIRPDRMEPVPSTQDYLSGWIYTGPNGEQVPLSVNEVILEKLPDPLDSYRGTGPVASILPNIQQQRYATDYQRNLFINGSEPGGVITVPSRLSEPEFDELTDRWREGHQGVARAGRVGVLENGATWTPSGQTNRDLEYGNLRLANRDELREAWRIHKHMLGTVDDVNRANAETAEDVFTGWSTIPRLNRRRSTLNDKLLPKFGTTGQGAEFDYDNPSPERSEAANQELLVKSQAAQALVAAGYDPSAVLETVGLPDMAIAEKATQAPALPPGWVPGMPPPADPAPGTDSTGSNGPELANLLRRVLSDGYVAAETRRR